MSLIVLTFLGSLSGCKPQPTELQLRAMDAAAMQNFQKDQIDEIMKTNGLTRAQAEAKDRSDRAMSERSTNNDAVVTPAEAKLLDDYSKHPKETVDTLCDEVTKNGC